MVVGAKPSLANDSTKRHSSNSFTGNGCTICSSLTQNAVKHFSVVLYTLVIDGANPS